MVVVPSETLQTGAFQRARELVGASVVNSTEEAVDHPQNTLDR